MRIGLLDYDCMKRLHNLTLSFNLSIVSFSSDSGGRVNPRRATEEMRSHKTIMLSFSLPRMSFSPESGGRVKSRRVMEEMGTHRTIMIHVSFCLPRVSFSPESGAGEYSPGEPWRR